MGVFYSLVCRINRLGCCILYRIHFPSQSSLPIGGQTLLVSNQISYCDPLVLSATAGRPITYIVARTLFSILAYGGSFTVVGSFPWREMVVIGRL
jgi:1-acyl-sn-glycerol-3-phosphate acyltransferase